MYISIKVNGSQQHFLGLVLFFAKRTLYGHETKTASYLNFVFNERKVLNRDGKQFHQNQQQLSLPLKH
jgi:hypothetical protein